MLDALSRLPSRSARDLLAHERIAIFGASPAAAPCVEAFLNKHGRAVTGYFDNATQKHGQAFRGHLVKDAEAARAHALAGGAVIIAAAYQQEIATQLVDGLSVPSDRVFPFISPMFENHFGRKAVEPWLNRLEAIIARCADKESQNYLAALAHFRWTMNPLELRRNPRQRGFYEYQAAGLGPHPGEHVIDCGAYTGDTAAVFWRRMDAQGKITAIEPVARNFTALEEWIASQNMQRSVRAYRMAIGAAKGQAFMSAQDGGPDPRAHFTDQTRSSAALDLCDIDTLDNLFADDLGGAGFLKIDIEGFELDALEGAKRMLAASKPSLAIAGYHAPGHWVEIPERLDTLCPGYRIHAGHHPSAPYECEFFCVHPDRSTAQMAQADA